MIRAEQLADEYSKNLDYYHYTADDPAIAYKAGYEQAEIDLADAFQAEYAKELARADLLAIVKEYMERGDRCMQQAGENGEQGVYTFWDGFHNCAENILRELEK